MENCRINLRAPQIFLLTSKEITGNIHPVVGPLDRCHLMAVVINSQRRTTGGPFRVQRSLRQTRRLPRVSRRHNEWYVYPD